MHLNEEIATAVFQYKMKMCEFMARDGRRCGGGAAAAAVRGKAQHSSMDAAFDTGREAAAETVCISRFILVIPHVNPKLVRQLCAPVPALRSRFVLWPSATRHSQLGEHGGAAFGCDGIIGSIDGAHFYYAITGEFRNLNVTAVTMALAELGRVEVGVREGGAGD